MSHSVKRQRGRSGASRRGSEGRTRGAAARWQKNVVENATILCHRAVLAFNALSRFAAQVAAPKGTISVLESKGELGVNADDDVARKDLRMAFGGMGLVILAALIATLLS